MPIQVGLEGAARPRASPNDMGWDYYGKHFYTRMGYDVDELARTGECGRGFLSQDLEM